MDLEAVVTDLADALAAVDGRGQIHKGFQPGIGPFGEVDAVRAALTHLRSERSDRYGAALTKRLPDLLIPGLWAIEFKIIRPFGDNGLPAEHWSENILHPYGGNTSSLGDCLKLLGSGLMERKAVVIIGYEHSPPRISLDPAIAAFELLAQLVLRLKLSPRIEVIRTNLIHPVHQQLRVFGYEVHGDSDA
jgi:hypothetical protein